MSEFTQALIPRIDQDGLIGASPNPGHWSGGNELLETSIACVMEVALNRGSADIQFLKDRQAAIARCQNPDGSLDKNPGRPDQITHDDILGVSCASRVCGMPFARTILKYAKAHDWDLSNTGQLYWDAIAKPWDRAVYRMNGSESPLWYEDVSLYGSVLVDSVRGDESSHRLLWIAREATDGVNHTLDSCFVPWRKRMASKYGTVGGLMSVYYKDKNHPYAVFGAKLNF